MLVRKMHKLRTYIAELINSSLYAYEIGSVTVAWIGTFHIES